MNPVVLKLSGKALDSFYGNSEWAKRILKIQSSSDGLILVHGAGTMISEWSKKLGCEFKFVEGQRATTSDVMEVVAAVQAGLLNAKVTAYLQANGLNSIGLTGIDMGMFVADYLNPEMGFVGVPKQTGSNKWLINLLRENVIPVFSSVCRDTDGNLMNVNADVFTERLGESVSAAAVLFLSDVDGVKLNGKTQPLLNQQLIDEGIESGEISGGMIPKLQSCLKLLKNGVGKIWIGKEDAFANESFTGYENLYGTWIVNE